jgi:cobalt-zinc-cadmium resistance protein CzcA
MIQRLVDFALTHRLLILAGALLLAAWGAVSFHNLPVEAYPDVANNYVNIITQWPGRAAEEVEQQVTIPIEIVMAGIPHVAYLRSFSLFGLSAVVLIFDDDSVNDWNRAKVLERLSQVTLPPGLTPVMGTDWSPVGQIFWYTLESTNPKYDLMELKAIQDWELVKQFKSVPDVAECSSFGGTTREYQVRIDPNKLVAYGLTLGQVEQQVTNNNVNAGGSFIQAGQQQVNVRAVGLFKSVKDIEETVIMTKNGTALRVRDIAEVTQGPKIRLGQIGKTIHRADGRLIDNNDVVEGIVALRKGADGEPTLRAINAKVRELNDHILPPGVKVVPWLDRSVLVHHTTRTVLRNLTEGVVLVFAVLILFLGNLRGAVVVAMTMPFALMFASVCLDLRHVPANLLSLGAIDFGMIVDGAVVMLENIVRNLGRAGELRVRGPLAADQHLAITRSVADRIRTAAHEVQRPVFYAITIIITAYLPIFTLERVEGRLFKPMAWTVAFALLGALIFSLLVIPVLASWLFASGVRERQNPVLLWLTERYRRAVTWSIHHHWAMVGVSVVSVAISLYLMVGGVIGSEFLPHLDEGTIWVRGTFAPSIGHDESVRVMNQARLVLASFPEATISVSQTGQPDDGTDITGFFNTEYFVDLKPKSEWRPVFRQDKDALIAAMSRELEKIPGVIWNFSQPIQDNMDEAVAGIKGQLAVKVYGPDLHTLEAKASEIVRTMRQVRGVQDLGVFAILGQPNLNITVNRQAAARFQINVAEVQDAIETAVGGKALTQVLQGERRFDVVARYLEPYRDTKDAIERIRLAAPSGERVALGQLATITTTDGATEIYREANSRYIAIKYSVRGRDLGGTVEEAIGKVTRDVQLPPGYRILWKGEYESQKRAEHRLLIIVPLTVFLIFMIIYGAFGSAKWACLNLFNVVVAPLGGVLALLVTGTNFSVSSGIGFMALFGVSVQIGVIMVEYINQLRARGMPVAEAAVEGAVRRLRPITMTMLVATLGLLPAALSHDIGSDSQRPFAIVIVGGLIADLAMSIFLLPTFYVWWARPTDHLPAPLPDAEPTEPAG